MSPAVGRTPIRALGSPAKQDSVAEGVLRRAGPAQENPDGAREVARAQGQEGEQEFIFSCLECACKPYLDIRRQSELEAAGAGEQKAPSPSSGSFYNRPPLLAPLSSFLGALGLL